MRRRSLATGALMLTGLALVAGVLIAGCLSSSEARSAPGPDALEHVSGPTPACTLVGCANGLTVALESSSEWPDGTYRFEIQADEVHVMCRASLPVPPCTRSKDIPLISSVTCDPMGVVQIVESGCALPTSAPVPSPAAHRVTHGFPAIVFDPALRPQQVQIAVRWNRRIVGHTALAPRFERLQPNGRACPPACYAAHSTLVLEFPGPGA
jgi:hypothetical protein